MGDELSISTTNQAGDGWVDQVPGPVSSGYQAQNTLISSTLIGIDKSEVSGHTTYARTIVEPSGPIDVDGQPFMITSQVSFEPRRIEPRTGVYFYIKVIEGSTWDKKSLALVRATTPPTYDHARRGLYFIDSAGVRERCLNWIVYIYKGYYLLPLGYSTPFRIALPGRSQFHIENFLNINGSETDWNFRFKAGDVLIGSYSGVRGENLTSYRSDYNSKGWGLVDGLDKSLQAVGGTFTVRFTATPSNLTGYSYTIEESPRGSSSRIVKGRRQKSDASVDNFEGAFPFSPYSSIQLYAKLNYRGVGDRNKRLTITNFNIHVSHKLSPLMRHLLEMEDF